MLLGVLVVAVLLRTTTGTQHGAQSPALTGSCTQPAFVASSPTVPAGSSFRVAITGPPRARYVLYLDVLAVVGTGGGLMRTPAPGVPVAQTQTLAQVDGLPSCLVRRDVTLSAGVRPGPHTLTLFRVDADAGQTRLATRTLTVS